MSRIFLSHAGAEKVQALALKQWLVEQNPPLDDDIFLDVDPKNGIQPSDLWEKVIQEKGEECQVMICLSSKAWDDSPECRFEFAVAKRWEKRVLVARLEDNTGQRAADYQRVDLFGGGPQTEIKVQQDDEDEPTTVTFPNRGLRRLRDAIIAHSIGAETFVWPPPKDKQRPPYRGWEALDEFDAAVFFGRGAQIVRALDGLRQMRTSEEETLFVILGPSGAGKSSFLRAGLLPRLRRDDTNYIVLDIVRPERNVITGESGLAESIYNSLEHYKISRRPLGEVKRICLEDAGRVGRMLHDIQQAALSQLGESAETPAPVLVLPVDQAEELFGLDAGFEAARFLELIGQHASTEIGQRVPLIVAITIRTDHVDALQNAQQLSAVRSVVFDDLKPMPEAEFKEVIEGPARRASQGGRALDVDPQLVERLLIDGTKGADTLPLLALTLARLYADYGADGRLELREYIAMGEMAEVVQTEIRKLLSRDETSRGRELALLRTAFIPHLATINPDNDQPVRRVAQWNAFDDEVKPLLEKFVQKRLLVKDSRETGDVVEVALESLLLHWDELKRWLAEESRDLKTAELLNREAVTWETNARDDDYLLRGRRLEEAEKLFKKSDYEEHIASAREFVSVSKRRARRRRTLVQTAVAVVMITALAVTVGLGMLAQSRKQTTAFRLLKEAEQMLQGSRPGGDVRALQQVLAALSLSPDSVDSAPDTGRTEAKILENPPKTATVGTTTTPVRSVAISRNSDRIAWASDDQTLRVWDSQTNETRHVRTGGDSASYAVAFSGDGKWLAAATGDAKLLLLDADSLASPIPPMRPNSAVLSVAFSPDSRSIAIGAAGGTVQVWDITGKPLFTRPATHVAGTDVHSVAFTPDGQFVVSGGDDHTVRLWNARTGEPASAPFADPSEEDTVFGVAVSPDGGRIIVGRANGKMQLLDGHTLERRSETKQVHPNDIESVAYSPDGTRIITGGGDNTIRVLESDTLTQIGSPLTGHHGTVQSVVYNLDGSRIVSGGFDGSVRIWDAVAAVAMPAKNGAEIRAVAFSPNGKRVALGDTNGTVTIWEAATGKFEFQLGQPCQPFDCSINSLAFDPDGLRLVAGATILNKPTGEVRIWDLTKPGQSTQLEMQIPPGVPAVQDGRVKSVVFSPKGSPKSVIAAAGWDGLIRVWDADNPVPQPITVERAHVMSGDKDVMYQVQSVAFSPDGRRLATGSGYNFNHTESNYLQLWKFDPSQDHPLARDGDVIEDSHRWTVLGVAFDAKGDRVISSGFDGTVRVFDVKSHERLALLSSDQNNVLSVAFAHAHPWIVTGAADGKVRLWDIDTYEPIGTPLTGHAGWVNDVTFSPNDEWILSGSSDKTARLWSSSTDLTKSICDKLTANMSHRQWKDWVARGNPLLRYEKVCPTLPVPE